MSRVDRFPKQHLADTSVNVFNENFVYYMAINVSLFVRPQNLEYAVL